MAGIVESHICNQQQMWGTRRSLSEFRGWPTQQPQQLVMVSGGRAASGVESTFCFDFDSTTPLPFPYDPEPMDAPRFAQFDP